MEKRNLFKKKMIRRRIIFFTTIGILTLTCFSYFGNNAANNDSLIDAIFGKKHTISELVERATELHNAKLDNKTIVKILNGDDRGHYIKLCDDNTIIIADYSVNDDLENIQKLNFK